MRFTNEAGWDRIARIVLGAVVLYLGWSGTVDGGLGDFLKVFGLVPLATGIVGWCPIYAAFGFRTNAKRSSEPAATV
ncbi:MAG TPA: DUF2892 domain-containing protein [Acidimicrobiia bacterium]